MIRLEKINWDNYEDVLKLKVTKEQEDYVADNDTSLIHAFLALSDGDPVYAFAIYNDDKVVGFIQMGYDDDWTGEEHESWLNSDVYKKWEGKKYYFIWRFMIDKKYQHKGYGKEALKKALTVKELNIENTIDQRTSMVLISLKPEPIPLDVKVILIGDANIYYTLLSLDEDFRKLFKIKVEFEEDAPRNEENIMRLAEFIRGFCKREEILELDNEAMAKIVEFSSSLADDKKKISTKFNEMSQIVAEASTWAKLDKMKIITSEYIQKALDERVERIKKYDSKYVEMIKENTLLISTSGSEVGQINGLTVMTIGDY